MFSSILKLVVIVGCLFVCDEILKVLNSTVVCTLALFLWQCQLPQWMKYCNFKFLNRFIYSWFYVAMFVRQCLVWLPYRVSWPLQVQLEHLISWERCVSEYKDLVRRIQERYGVRRPSCRLDLKEFQAFLDSKLSKALTSPINLTVNSRAKDR